MRKLVYTQSSPVVLLPHMYMHIPIDYIKRYHIYRERYGHSLPLGIVYAKKNYLLGYGCTAMIVSYNEKQSETTILGLERFQKCLSISAAINRVAYVFDRASERENVWVKQLRIIECLERIAHRNKIYIDIQEIKNIHALEFSFAVATLQLFGAKDRYRLLATKTIGERLDIAFALLNARELKKR